MDEDKAPSPKMDEPKSTDAQSVDNGANVNPFEEPEVSSTNPFGSDHEMDAHAGGENKSESTEMDTNTEPNSAEASVVSTDSKDPAPAPQLSPEEQARLEQARKISQKEVLNGGNTPAALARKRKTPEELAKLPTRSYLDETVVPVLLVGMSELARRRPERPLEWLAKYLMSKQEGKEGTEPEENGIEKGGDADELARAGTKGRIFSQDRPDAIPEQAVSDVSSI